MLRKNETIKDVAGTLHPLAAAIPLLSEADLTSLVEEVRERGCPRLLLRRGEVILDDPNLLRACELAGVTPTWQQWNGEGSLAEVVAHAIIPRVHLTDSQRAALAVPIADQLESETIPRRNAGLLRGHPRHREGRQENAKTAFPANGTVSAKLQQRSDYPASQAGNRSKINPAGPPAEGKAAERAAQLCHVSPRYVYDARKLRDEDRELFDRVRRGDLNLSQASLQLSKRLREKRSEQSESSIGKRSIDDDKLIVGVNIAEMEKIPNASFPLIWTDPPYNNGWKYDSDPTRDRLKPEKYLEWIGWFMQDCARLLTPTGSMFILISGEYAGRFDGLMRRAGLHWRNTIVWHDLFPIHHDTNFQMAARFLLYFTKHETKFTFNDDAVRIESERDRLGDKRRVHAKGIVPHNVWDVSRVMGNQADRVPFEDSPPQVPALIIERCILAASNAGDRVFDPFAGNGTTWKAANKLGRKFTGIERSPLYAEQARKWVGMP